MAEKLLTQIPQWKKGDPLSAVNLNRTVDELNRRSSGVEPPKQMKPEAGIVVRQFRILPGGVGDDHLVCEAFDGTSASGSAVLIAKSYMLRKTPFHNLSRAGVSYVYTDPVTRTATLNQDVETQVIVPDYRAFDVIFACRNMLGGSGVTVSDSKVLWVDMNFDGRAWAKQ